MQAIESYRENPFLWWNPRPERPLDDAGTATTYNPVTPDGNTIFISDITNNTATIRINRTGESDTATLGELTIDGTDFTAFTLEPPGPGSTVEGSGLRIPAGTYDVTRFSSPSHPNVFQIQNVPGRSAVLFHIGNTAADTRGCICMGTSQGTNSVSFSGNAFSGFRNTLSNYGNIRVVITNGF